MAKRPLAWLCLAVVIVLSLAGRVSGAKRTAALAGLENHLTEAAGADAAIRFEAVVAKTQAVPEGERLSLNHISIATKDNSHDFLSSEIQFILTTETERFLPGDRVLVTGSYRPFSDASNPGEFDARAYYFSMDTVGRILDPELTLLSGKKFSIYRLPERIRRALRHSYEEILEEKSARTIAAIALGEKNLIDPEVKLLFQEGGIAHMISVSGLHISMIGMCLYELLRRLRMPILAAALSSAVLVAGYTLMTGAQLPALRACLMFVIWLGAQILGRKRDMGTALAIAAAVILIRDARQIRGSSFLLSFGALLAIVLFVPELQAANPFGGKKKRGFERAWNTLSASAGVWIATLPVTLWFFYQSAPWSILVNLVVIPLLQALMAFGLLSGLIGLLSSSLGTFFAAPVHYLLALFEGLCRAQQKLPGSLWIAGRPDLWEIVLFYLLLFAAGSFCFALRRKKKQSRERRILADTQGKCTNKEAGDRTVRETRACGERKERETGAGGDRRAKRQSSFVPFFLWAGVIFCGCCLMNFRTRKELTVIDLDVGQGDCALAAFPDGTNCLIDGGSSSESEIWSYRIARTLKYYGIGTLDYVFLSHADSDHMNGVEEFLEDYLPGFGGKNAHGITLRTLVLPPTEDPEDFSGLRHRAGELGIPVLRMQRGDRVEAEDQAWTLNCLAPDRERLTGEKNEDSLVLLLRYGCFRMLFTGDLEGEGERMLASDGSDLACDVLKVGHHGSKGGSSEAFLSAAAPDIGILSCGKNNRYGHPAPEAVARLHAAGTALYATMDCGAVILHTDGSRLLLQGYLKTVEYR